VRLSIKRRRPALTRPAGTPLALEVSDLASVGSGTAGAVTTDSHGDGYEVTVKKTDGSTVEVHLDSSFNVQQGHH